MTVKPKLLGLVLLGAVGGGCGSVTAPNAPPTAALAIAPPGPALASVTVVIFNASGSDPEGDPLSFAWDFGDGASGTGTTATHVYEKEGVFQVVLMASDRRGGTTMARGSVTARTLNGRWTPLQNGVPGIEAQITQAGRTFSGWAQNSCCRHSFTGTLSEPRQLTLVMHFSGCPGESRTFAGSLDEALNRIDASGPNCNVPVTTYGFVRP